MHINNQPIIGSRVLYRGWNFTMEATIKDSKRTKFGTVEVLLQPDSGFPMWRAAGDCKPIECPAQYVGMAV